MTFEDMLIHFRTAVLNILERERHAFLKSNHNDSARNMALTLRLALEKLDPETYWNPKTPTPKGT